MPLSKKFSKIVVSIMDFSLKPAWKVLQTKAFFHYSLRSWDTWTKKPWKKITRRRNECFFREFLKGVFIKYDQFFIRLREFNGCSCSNRQEIDWLSRPATAKKKLPNYFSSYSKKNLAIEKYSQLKRLIQL